MTRPTRQPPSAPSTRIPPRRHWLAIPDDHKPPSDMADLLGMDLMDAKAPPMASAAGAGDLLDTLVQDDLARALEAAPEENLEVAAIEGPGRRLAEDKNQLLQREIDLLLHGDGREAADVAVREAEANGDESVVDEPMTDAANAAGEARLAAAIEEAKYTNVVQTGAGESTEIAAAVPIALTQAEINTLVPEENPVEEPLAAAPAPRADAATADTPTDDETASGAQELAREMALDQANVVPHAEGLMNARGEAGLDDESRQLSEAEGVLASELAQLMSEEKPAAAGAAPVRGETPTAQPTAEAEHESIDEVNPIPATATALAVPEAVTTTPAATSVDTATTSPADPPVPVRPVDAPAPGFASRMVQAWSNFILLILQLVDIPFTWASDYDRELIGFAALMLVLSGALLRLLAWYYS